ncbi:hypothetical protein ES703_11329 [subsurface metagenome]
MIKVSITGHLVVFDDYKGNDIHMSTNQLLDLFRILCIAVKEDGGLLFKTLEFTV